MIEELGGTRCPFIVYMDSLLSVNTFSPSLLEDLNVRDHDARG